MSTSNLLLGQVDGSTLLNASVHAHKLSLQSGAIPIGDVDGAGKHHVISGDVAMSLSGNVTLNEAVVHDNHIQLDEGNIFLGQGGDVALQVPFTGDVEIDSDGTTHLASTIDCTDVKFDNFQIPSGTPTNSTAAHAYISLLDAADDTTVTINSNVYTFQTELNTGDDLGLGEAGMYALIAQNTVTGTPTIAGGGFQGNILGTPLSGEPEEFPTDDFSTRYIKRYEQLSFGAHATQPTGSLIIDSEIAITSSSSTDLNGVTTGPGIYQFIGQDITLSGTVTLDASSDAHAMFIFITNQRMTVANSTTVTLINSANANNILWIFDSGTTTLGTSVAMKGTIMTSAGSITVGNSSAVVGRLIADSITFGTGITVTLPTGARKKARDVLTFSDVPVDQDTLLIDTTTYTWVGSLFETFAFGEFHITGGNFVNNQTIRAGTTVYTFKTTMTETQATGVLTMGPSLPASGSTITVGTTTYTFRLKLAQPYDVLIDQTVSLTLDNFVDAVNADLLAEGVTFGFGTAAHPTVSADKTTTTTVTLTCLTGGIGGNTVATTRVGNAMSFDETTLTGAVASVANQVEIAADSDLTMQRLIAAINGEDGAGIDYSSSTVPNADVTAERIDSTHFIVTSLTAGTAGNSIVTTTTCTNGSWSTGSTLVDGFDEGLANDVLIGETIDDCMDNLISAMQAATIGDGVVYYTGTVAHLTIDALLSPRVADTLVLRSKVYGTDGNGLDVTEAGSGNITVGTATMAGGVGTSEIGYVANAENIWGVDTPVTVVDSELIMSYLIAAINAEPDSNVYGNGTLVNPVVSASFGVPFLSGQVLSVKVTAITPGPSTVLTVATDAVYYFDLSTSGAVSDIFPGTDGTVAVQGQIEFDENELSVATQDNGILDSNWARVPFAFPRANVIVHLDGPTPVVFQAVFYRTTLFVDVYFFGFSIADTSLGPSTFSVTSVDEFFPEEFRTDGIFKFPLVGMLDGTTIITPILFLSGGEIGITNGSDVGGSFPTGYSLEIYPASFRYPLYTFLPEPI